MPCTRLRARARHAAHESLVNLGLDAANTAALALPGGAFIVGGLSLLNGLMLKLPSEDERVVAEKEDSHNAGIEDGKRIVLSAVDLGKQAETQHNQHRDN